MQAVSVRYDRRIAVDAASVAFGSGTVTALVGPNGAGKSSLLKAIAGVIPHGGGVRFRGRPLAPLDSRERSRLIAYLPQQARIHWPMRVRDLVALGRLPYRAHGQPDRAADHDAIDWAMRQTEVASLAERRADELSGGERSRILLARALAVRSPVLLVDEPVASLDPYHQLQIMAALGRYAESGRLVIVVMHDLCLAARFAQRLLLISGGRLLGDGAPERVLTAATLRRHYRVDPFLTEHDGQPVIIPWRKLE